MHVSVEHILSSINAIVETDDPGDLQTLMVRLTDLENEMYEEKKLRCKLEDEMTAERREMDGKLAAEREIRDQEITALTEANAATKDMIQTINEHIARNVTEQIAFFVHTESNWGPVSVRTKIPFPFENVNIGGGWQSNIDAFQAPIAGHYFFFASILSVPDTRPYVRIVHTPTSGDIIVAGLLSSGSMYNGDANAVILYLEEGDYVSVQLNPDASGIVYSSVYKYTTFSGFLLA